MLKPAKSTSRFYILTANAPALFVSHLPPTGRGGYRLRLEPIVVADYLRTKQMVVREAKNEISFAQFHEWAEPLDYGIRRVLAERLRSSPMVQEVLTAESTSKPGPVVSISLSVLTCQGVRLPGRSSVEFQARWEITGPNSLQEQGVFEMPSTGWNGQDYGQLAQRLSQGQEELAGTLLEALSRHVSLTGVAR